MLHENEALPMSVIIAREQAKVVALAIAEVTEHMHRTGMRRTDAKR